MRTYIKDLRPGDHVSAIFRLLDCQGKGDNPRGPELTLKLGDKTGDIRAIKWKAPGAPFGYEDAAYVHVAGVVSDKGYGLQIELDGVGNAENMDMDEAELIRCASMEPHAIDGIFSELKTLIDDVPLSRLLDAVLEIAGQEFYTYPAARGMHHAVRYGLYQHSVEVAQAAYRLALCPQWWNYRPVDIGVVIVGALIHDVGKVIEYREKPSGDFETSTEGALIGHINLGVEMLMQAARSCGYDNQCRLTALVHIIASHHGRQEWGSPVTPATDEAVCVHLADMFSMQINVMNDLRDKAKSGDVTAKRADIRAVVG